MSERANERGRQFRDLEEVMAELREWSDEQVADGLEGHLPHDVTLHNVAAEAAEEAADQLTWRDDECDQLRVAASAVRECLWRREKMRFMRRDLRHLRLASTDAPEERRVRHRVLNAAERIKAKRELEQYEKGANKLDDLVRELADIHTGRLRTDAAPDYAKRPVGGWSDRELVEHMSTVMFLDEKSAQVVREIIRRFDGGG